MTDTQLIAPGARWLDGSFSRPPAEAVLRNGYTGFVGYVSRPPSDPAKNVTPAECEAYLAAGLDMLLVWEMSATTASKGGDVGKQHGDWARIEAETRGFPVVCPLIAADDTNTIAQNINAQEAYMRGFDSTCPHPHAIYGDTDICARLADITTLMWVPVSAWAWSSAVSQADAIRKATALGAHVLQYKGFALDGRWNVDPNTSINEFLAWSTRPTPPVISPAIDTPPQKERTMITNKQVIDAQSVLTLKNKGLLESDDDAVIGVHRGYWQAMDDGSVRHITDKVAPGSGFSEVLARGGEAQAVEVDTAVLLSFTKWMPPTAGGGAPAPTRFSGTIESVPGPISLTAD